jgi:hypothetical protein
MIRLSAITLSAGLATVLLMQASVPANAAPDGRKYKMLSAPLVLGSVRKPPSQQSGGMGFSAGPRRQGIGSLLVPAVQAIRDTGRGGGGSRPKPSGPEDCMSCAN